MLREALIRQGIDANRVDENWEDIQVLYMSLMYQQIAELLPRKDQKVLQTFSLTSTPTEKDVELTMKRSTSVLDEFITNNVDNIDWQRLAQNALREVIDTIQSIN